MLHPVPLRKLDTSDLFYRYEIGYLQATTPKLTAPNYSRQLKWPSGRNSILFSYVYYHGQFIMLWYQQYPTVGPPHAVLEYSYSCCRVLSWSCDLRFRFADDFDNRQLRASLSSSLVKDMWRVKVFL